MYFIQDTLRVCTCTGYTVQHKLSTGIMNVLTTNGVDEYSLISF